MPELLEQAGRQAVGKHRDVHVLVMHHPVAGTQRSADWIARSDFLGRGESSLLKFFRIVPGFLPRPALEVDRDDGKQLPGAAATSH